jgi:hypothetical protein
VRFESLERAENHLLRLSGPRHRSAKRKRWERASAGRRQLTLPSASTASCSQLEPA